MPRKVKSKLALSPREREKMLSQLVSSHVMAAHAAWSALAGFNLAAFPTAFRLASSFWRGHLRELQHRKGNSDS